MSATNADLKNEMLEAKAKPAQEPTHEQLKDMVAQLTGENRRITEENAGLKQGMQNLQRAVQQLKDLVVYTVEVFKGQDTARAHEQAMMRQAAMRNQGGD